MVALLLQFSHQIAPEVISRQLFKVVGTEILVAALRLQHVVDRHQDAVSNGDHGPLLAPAGGQTPELRGIIRILARRPRPVDTGPVSPSRLKPVGRRPPQPLARTLVVAGRHASPKSQCLTGTGVDGSSRI